MKHVGPLGGIMVFGRLLDFLSFVLTFEPMYGVFLCLHQLPYLMLYLKLYSANRVIHSVTSPVLHDPPKITTRVGDNHKHQIEMQWYMIFALLEIWVPQFLFSIEEATSDHFKLHSICGVFQPLHLIHKCDSFPYRGRMKAFTNLSRHTIILGCSLKTSRRLGAKL